MYFVTVWGSEIQEHHVMGAIIILKMFNVEMERRKFLMMFGLQYPENNKM